MRSPRMSVTFCVASCLSAISKRVKKKKKTLLEKIYELVFVFSHTSRV